MTNNPYNDLSIPNSMYVHMVLQLGAKVFDSREHNQNLIYQLVLGSDEFDLVYSPLLLIDKKEKKFITLFVNFSSIDAPSMGFRQIYILKNMFNLRLIFSTSWYILSKNVLNLVLWLGMILSCRLKFLRRLLTKPSSSPQLEFSSSQSLNPIIVDLCVKI